MTAFCTEVLPVTNDYSRRKGDVKQTEKRLQVLDAGDAGINGHWKRQGTQAIARRIQALGLEGRDALCGCHVGGMHKKGSDLKGGSRSH